MDDAGAGTDGFRIDNILVVMDRAGLRSSGGGVFEALDSLMQGAMDRFRSSGKRYAAFGVAPNRGSPMAYVLMAGTMGEMSEFVLPIMFAELLPNRPSVIMAIDGDPADDVGARLRTAIGEAASVKEALGMARHRERVPYPGDGADGYVAIETTLVHRSWRAEVLRRAMGSKARGGGGSAAMGVGGIDGMVAAWLGRSGTLWLRLRDEPDAAAIEVPADQWTRVPIH